MKLHWVKDQYSDIINGVPVSCGCSPLTEDEKPRNMDTGLFTDADKNVQDAVMAWIGLHIEPAKRKKHNSYALKHRIASDIRNEQHIEIYLTNNQFKHAMLLAGFMPVDKTKLNWDFRVKIV